MVRRALSCPMVAMLALLVFFAKEAPAQQCGDVSGDGLVDLVDWVLVDRALASLPPGMAQPDQCNSAGPVDPTDPDGDGVPIDCDAADVAAIRQELAGAAPGIADVCDPLVVRPDCEIRFVPQAVTAGEQTRLYWTSELGSTCSMECDGQGEPLPVPCSGHHEVDAAAAAGLGCTLTAQTAGGIATTVCSGDLALAGACSPPSCEIAYTGDAAAGFTLVSDSDGETCSYSCDGLGVGALPCNGELFVGSEPLDCQVYASSSCGSISSCTSSSWSTPIAIDGELEDWPPGTAFPTDGGFNHITWDAENLYVGIHHPDIGSDDDRYNVMIYLGNGGPGLTESVLIGTQQSALPVEMTHAIRWRPSGTLGQLLTPDAAGGGWIAQDNWLGTEGSAAAHDAATGQVEFRIPLARLGTPDSLLVHVNLVDELPGAEKSYASTPYLSHPDGYMGAGSGYEAVYRFDLHNLFSPNQSIVLRFPIIRPPEPTPPGTGQSLRLMTYNTAFIDIPDLPITVCGLVHCLFLTPSMFMEVDNEDTFGIDDEVRAGLIAAGILRADADVVVLNEVFDSAARARLVDDLRGQFPYIVTEISDPLEVFLDGLEPQIRNFDDSGLMLFSRYPFIPLSNTTHLAPDDAVELELNGSILANSTGGWVAWLGYDEACSMPDCLASKGVALVRIQKDDDQRATIAFTHLEASYSDDDAGQATGRRQNRVAQMALAEQLIVETLTPNELELDEVYLMGDLNIIGRFGPVGHAVQENETHPDPLSQAEAEDYDLSRQEWIHHFCGYRSGAPVSGDPCFNSAPNPDLPSPSGPGFFTCGDGSTGIDCPDPGPTSVMVDSWAFDSSDRDLGQSNGAGFYFDRPERCTEAGTLLSRVCAGERLDYVLHNKPGSADSVGNRSSLCAQHDTIAWEVGAMAGMDQHSDHLPVRADMNRWAPLCRPRDAQPILEGDFSNQASTYVAPGQILFPGGMQWYRLEHPGSYSIDADLGYEVYAANDLSRPLLPYHNETTRFGDRYVLAKPPYYIRVFAEQPSPPAAPGTPDRTWTGTYTLTVHLHRCDGPGDDSCPITAGVTLPYVWPGDRPLNVEDATWWDINTNVGDTGAFPVLNFDIQGAWITNYTFQIVEATAPYTVIFDSDDIDPSNDFLEGPTSIGLGRLHALAQGLAGTPGLAGRKYYWKIIRKQLLETGGTPCASTFPPCVPLPQSDLTMDVGWGTTLTYFYPLHLLVDDQEDDAILWFTEHDEPYYFLDPDSPDPSTAIDGRFAFFGEVLEGGHPWPAGFMGIKRYAQNLQISFVEQNDASPDEYLIPASPPLGGCESSGLCTLPVADSTYLGDYVLSDNPGATDAEDREYFYRLKFCARHEEGSPNCSE